MLIQGVPTAQLIRNRLETTNIRTLLQRHFRDVMHIIKKEANIHAETTREHKE